MVRRSDGSYELEGSMLLEDFLETIGRNTEDFEAESSTVGGWTLEMFGGFPKVGDSFRYEDMTVTVLSMVDGRRVGKVLVQLDEKKDEE
ncbi:MAG: transporter associated domain-containing protein [Oscillospiraceae bacterium]